MITRTLKELKTEFTPVAFGSLMAKSGSRLIVFRILMPNSVSHLMRPKLLKLSLIFRFSRRIGGLKNEIGAVGLSDSVA